MGSRSRRRLDRLGVSVVGETPDGRKVVRGTFKLVNERGVPLPVLLDHFQRVGLVIDWEDFVTQAFKTGWLGESILTRVEEALVDSVSRDERREIIWRLMLLILRVHNSLLESQEIESQACDSSSPSSSPSPA